MTTIGFYEHTDSGCVDDLIKTINQLNFSIKIGNTLNELTDYDVVIVHTNNNDNWSNFLKQSKQNSVRIRISTAGFSQPKNLERLALNGVYVLHLREKTTQVKEQWEEILTGITDQLKLDNLVNKPSEKGLGRFFVKTQIVIIPALSILCQGYLAVHQGNQIYSEVEKLNLIDNIEQKKLKTEESEWWQYPFKAETKKSLTQNLKKELQLEESELLPSEISGLIDAIYDESITEDKVKKAYDFIVKRLV